MEAQSQRVIEKILDSELRDQSSIEEILQNQTQHEQSVQMVIQLGGDKSRTIRIHQQDDPLILAKAFCFQHNIDPRIIRGLANKIKNVKNVQFNQQNQNKSKIQSNVDKQNNHSLINVSQSINESFNKCNVSTKNKGLDRSSMARNDATSISNDCSRLSVFDRLYQHSRNKKVVNSGLDEPKERKHRISASTLQASHISSDPCLLIYQKNTKAHQSALMKRQQLQQQKQQKVTEFCTFKPQINPISEIIARRLPESYRSQLKRVKDVKIIQEYLQQKQRKQTQQCTFQPKILNKSRSKSAERWKFLQQGSRLDWIKRKNSQQVLERSMGRAVVKMSKISQCMAGDRSFFQRLQSDQQRRKQRKCQVEAQLKEQKNKGPSVNKRPRIRPANISIGEYLYKQGGKSRQKHTQPSTIKRKLICQNSDLIYENSKRTAFAYIFALLDSDEDGLVSSTKIQLCGLQADVLKLFAPLLMQLQQIEAQLDEDEFGQALNRLFNGFSVSEKQKILNVHRFKNKLHSQAPPFKPSLNQRSLLWARQTRPQKLDLYQLWKLTQTQKQQRLQQVRTFKVLQELQQCTFHPRLFR